MKTKYSACALLPNDKKAVVAEKINFETIEFQKFLKDLNLPNIHLVHFNKLPITFDKLKTMIHYLKEHNMIPAAMEDMPIYLKDAIKQYREDFEVKANYSFLSQ
ncbi:MAG: hypothetical protein J0G32_05250 [Alphaproteobacteria bacterium]|nr:hypothetical protein [Alphaproteobacteria bacterium]OJV13605.1 MAG: hypothetical protein BGO27_03210 [Alphaproteobacteria bacterium 33-17]